MERVVFSQHCKCVDNRRSLLANSSAKVRVPGRRDGITLGIYPQGVYSGRHDPASPRRTHLLPACRRRSRNSSATRSGRLRWRPRRPRRARRSRRAVPAAVLGDAGAGDPGRARREMFAMIVGYTLPDIAGLAWVSPVLGTVMFVWGGRPFLTGAVERDAAPRARDDAADRARDHGRVRRRRGARASGCSTTSSTSGGSWRC